MVYYCQVCLAEISNEEGEGNQADGYTHYDCIYDEEHKK